MTDHDRETDTRRRTMIAVAGAAFAAGPDALAQAPSAPARAKGPLVWLDMDQAELDAAYDQSRYAPNQPQITARYRSNSDITRSRLGNPQRHAYGKAEIEKLDLYTASRANAPVNVFLHGGAWRNNFARDYAYLAEVLVHAGAHSVMPDFAWVQDLGGDLMPMADQVRRAIAWVRRNAASFGGDPERIYLSGHSSGAHLAGVALVTDWRRDFGLPQDFIRGALLCSGMYDLKPVRLSARSNYVKFTDESEQQLSAQRHLPLLQTPVIVAYGTLETPEFQRQSREFAAAVRAAGKPAELIVAQGYNHFEILETLGNPHGLLGRAMLAQMQLRID